MSTEQYDYAAWDNEMDTNAISREAKKIEAGDKKVPHGIYEVALDNISMFVNKKGFKTMAFNMVVVAGENEGCQLTYYQTLEGSTPKLSAFFIHKANEFMRSLKPGIEIPSFTSWANLAATIEAVKQSIADNGWEYQLNYGTDKGYDTFAIEGKFEKEDNPF